MLENTVQIAVLSPLLHLAGFLSAPFHIKSEESIQISAVDDEVTIDGRIDVFVLSEQLWVIVIESKQTAFSIETGLAQLLAYMLGSPHPERPTFGMITTGGTSIFVKVVRHDAPQYGLSI